MTEQPPRKDYGAFDNLMRELGSLLTLGARKWWSLSWKWRAGTGVGALALLLTLGAVAPSNSEQITKAELVDTVAAIATPKSGNVPKATDTPKPTNTPKPTSTPSPTPTPLPTKGESEYLDPRILAADAKAYKGKNILVQGKALNVDQKSDYTWIQVTAGVRGRNTNESIVVELRPKRTDILRDECYRFYGTVEGVQKVKVVLTGAETEVPLVKGYDAEPAPRDQYDIGCASP